MYATSGGGAGDEPGEPCRGGASPVSLRGDIGVATQGAGDGETTPGIVVQGRTGTAADNGEQCRTVCRNWARSKIEPTIANDVSTPARLGAPKTGERGGCGSGARRGEPDEQHAAPTERLAAWRR